jgi:hypothetical protein
MCPQTLLGASGRGGGARDDGGGRGRGRTGTKAGQGAPLVRGKNQIGGRIKSDLEPASRRLPALRASDHRRQSEYGGNGGRGLRREETSTPLDYQYQAEKIDSYMDKVQSTTPVEGPCQVATS